LLFLSGFGGHDHLHRLLGHGYRKAQGQLGVDGPRLLPGFDSNLGINGSTLAVWFDLRPHDLCKQREYRQSLGPPTPAGEDQPTPGSPLEGLQNPGAFLLGFKVDEDDIVQLRLLNADELKCFEAADGAHAEDGYVNPNDSKPAEDIPEPLADAIAQSLEDTKIKMFVATMKDLSKIVVFQVAFLFLVRALRGTTFEEQAGSLYLTCEERTWATYWDHLKALPEHATNRAVDVLWMLL